MIKNLPTSVGDIGLIPVWEDSPGERNGYPLQYSCLGNPMDRGAWRGTVHGVTKKSDTTERLIQQQQADAWFGLALRWELEKCLQVKGT